jgi:hypothetical protein
MTSISSLGVDADGNQYYGDSVSGKVLEVSPSGATTTLASGLSQPIIAVDYLGDVFIADTGTSRVLKIAAWPSRTTSVLASISKQHALALDGANNVFILSGDQLVEIPIDGSAVSISTIPGASLLGLGSGSNGEGHLYIVSGQDGNYAARRYTYNYGGGSGALSGPLKNFLPNLAGASLGGMFVDPQGDPIVEANVARHGKVVISSSNGYKHALFTAGIPFVPMAQDAVGNLYYVNGPSLIRIQLGAVNFGLQDLPNRSANTLAERTLNFGAPPNVHWVLSEEPTGGQFLEGDLASGSGPLLDQSQLYFYYSPTGRSVGYTSGFVNITDQNNVNTLSIPLVATATDGGYAAYYLPAPNLKAHPSFQPVVSAQAVPQTAEQTVISRCACGTFLLDRRAGRVTREGIEIVAGLQNVHGADVDARGNLYFTQGDVAGVLRVGADHSTSRIATDIPYPMGSAMDGMGNLYILNGDDIVRVAADGSETVFATPVTNGGFTSLLSIAVDLFNNIYAGYGNTTNANHGAILKFSPAGGRTLVPTDTKKPTGLAVYPCGAVFFADAERGTLNVVPGYKREKIIGFGLTNPTNLQCEEGGAIRGEDPGIAGGQFALSPIPFGPGNLFFDYDFGKVAVGSSRSITLSSVAVGSSASAKGPAGYATFYGQPSPNFSPNQTITTGVLTEILLGFKPTAAGRYGPFGVTILDPNDDETFSGLETLRLSGTGVTPP